MPLPELPPVCEPIRALATATMTLEGPRILGPPWRNPMALRAYRLGQQTVAGYRVFDSLRHGLEAGCAQLRLSVRRHLTIREHACGRPGAYRGYAAKHSCHNYALMLARLLQTGMGARLDALFSVGAEVVE